MSEDRPFSEEDAEDAAPPHPDAADPKHHRRIRDAAKREQNEALEFWGGIFASEVGRREMWAILESAGAFRERFAVASPTGYPDQMATMAMQGEQRLGFRLYMSWLRLCPDGVQKMLFENHPDLRPPPKPKRRQRSDMPSW